MLLDRLSIQSKLLLAMLTVSVGSILVIGYLGFSEGRDIITAGVESRLAGMRQVRSDQVQSLLIGVRNQATTLAADEGTVQAVKAFRDAYKGLAEKPVSAEMQGKLASFYRDRFFPALVANLKDVEPSLDLFLPRGNAARYLQYRYIAASSEDYEKKRDYDGEGDDTPYGQAHRNHHPKFRDVVRKFEYEDLLLIDPETLDVVYSEEKTTEFATSLKDGPYARTGLADLVGSIRKAKDRAAFGFSDFEFYYPDLGLPNAFLACPIFDGPALVGILAIEFPIKAINRVMTGSEHWEQEGLGKTGETYLVGGDTKMRSRARSLLKDETEVVAALRRAGVPDRTIGRIEAMHTIVLNLPVRSEAVRRALEGETGIVRDVNYKDARVVSAFAPISFDGVRWGIVAEMEREEAYAPIRDFGRQVLAYSAGIVVAVTLLAVLLAAIIVRPIRRLIAGARRVEAGQTDVHVHVAGHDEFRELADAFNRMTRSLKAKSETIDQKVRENEALLLNVLPGPILARRKGADDRAPEAFADISVLFAEIAGFTELSESVKPAEAVDLLNELIGAIDEAAERIGVEKVKTFGSSYMAVCGLASHRPDHASRMVEFALEVLRVVRRFNQAHGAGLAAEVGVNAGPVVGGIVGRSKFIYDLWGDTVNIAQAIRLGAPRNGVAVSETVKDRLKDVYEFEPLSEVEVRGKGKLAAWAVKAED